MKKQTLFQAIHLALVGADRDISHAASVLAGKPVGGWGETRQAEMDIRNALPRRDDRAYTAGEFIDANYYKERGYWRGRTEEDRYQRARNTDARRASKEEK